jgi:hypothetical protein
VLLAGLLIHFYIAQGAGYNGGYFLPLCLWEMDSQEEEEEPQKGL